MVKSKAFDLIKFSLLFRKMLTARLSLIFLRLIIYVFVNQFCNVKWNNKIQVLLSKTVLDRERF